MGDWQNWVVGLLLLLCVFRIGQRICTFSRGVKEKRNPCENCATDCELKNLYGNKGAVCTKKEKEIKKKCSK